MGRIPVQFTAAGRTASRRMTQARIRIRKIHDEDESESGTGIPLSELDYLDSAPDRFGRVCVRDSFRYCTLATLAEN